MFLEKAILKKQELDALRPFKKEIEEKVMQKLRIDWNYHSNSIEGNSLTYGETKSLLLHHITAQGKPLRDHFEITGHNEAINIVLDVVKGDRNITENFIRELHKLILKENYTKKAITSDGKETTKEIKVGVYKTESNHVLTKTGETFYFAEPFEVSSKMNDLLEWYNSEIQRKDFNPILIATEFHYKFVRIHPFDDGNGRLSRILMNFILVKFGYHPAIIKKEIKERYFEVLRIADGGNIEPFVEFISASVFNSLDLMHKAIHGIAFEDDNDVDKQFWLLDQKLKGLKTNETKNKSEFNYIDLISKIHDHFKKENEAFNKYYSKISFNSRVVYSNNNDNKSATIEQILSKKNNFKIIYTSIKYEFKESIPPLNSYYYYEIKIDFGKNENSYEFIYEPLQGDTMVLNVNKSEPLQHVELISLSHKIKTNHIKFIDQNL